LEEIIRPLLLVLGLAGFSMCGTSIVVVVVVIIIIIIINGGRQEYAVDSGITSRFFGGGAEFGFVRRGGGSIQHSPLARMMYGSLKRLDFVSPEPENLSFRGLIRLNPTNRSFEGIW
jgi:hypothetical protein